MGHHHLSVIIGLCMHSQVVFMMLECAYNAVFDAPWCEVGGRFGYGIAIVDWQDEFATIVKLVNNGMWLYSKFGGNRCWGVSNCTSTQYRQPCTQKNRSEA